MNENKNVLVILSVDEVHRKLLEKNAPNAEFVYAVDREPDLQMAENANIIIGNPRRSLLKHAKKLEWLQLESAGANLYAKDGVLPENVLLTNATGSYGLVISEYMISMVLNLFLKQYLYKENQEKHLWHDEGTVKSIYGSTALILGLGDIGGEFAKRFKALGGHTIGVRRTDAQKPDFVDELYLMDKLDELLPRADVVALSLPETKETIKLIDAHKLARMKKGSILVNVGRGSAIDTNALCDALNSGHLAGAALDVTDPEPVPPDHPLWDTKNVLITPHISGGYNLPETYEKVFQLCADNLGRYFRGEELQNIVDFSTGYKKR